VTITPEEYLAKLHRAFKVEELKGFMLGVAGAYPAARDHCKRHYELPDRPDMLGRDRRAKVHEAVRGVAERFELAHKNEPNVNGSIHFLCISSGEFRLICCAVPSRKSMVRPAIIRKVLARENFDAQEGLFPDAENSSIGINLKHLAILVHAPNGRHKDEAGFVDIVIPDSRVSKYIQRLELFKLFPAETAEYKKLFTRRKRRFETGTA
jgi:hypothetical protein